MLRKMDIILQEINKNYKTKKIFENFNLTVNKGEMLAITGKSGTGKSTLLNIIGLIDKPDKGNVIICGEKNAYNNEKLQRKLFRSKIGYLFQNYALVDNYTVSKNLDIALQYVKNINKEKLKEDVLRKVGLYEKLNNKVFELSGGEQQRIALARLMLKNNDIILADEPTGSLDEINRDIILNLLKELNQQGKTIVIVTHDNIVANMCTRNIKLNNI